MLFSSSGDVSCATVGIPPLFPVLSPAVSVVSVLSASVVVVPDCVSSVAPLSSADSVVSAVFSRKTLLPYSAAVKSRDAVPSTTSL